VLKELDREQPLAELYRAAPPAGEPRGPEDGKTRNDAVVRSSPLLRAALRTNVVLSDTAVRLLTEPAAQALRQYEIEPGATPVRDIQARLVTEQQRLASGGLTLRLMDLSKLHHDIRTSEQTSELIGDLLGRYRLDPIDDPATNEPVASAPPSTHANVRPLGNADLNGVGPSPAERPAVGSTGPGVVDDLDRGNLTWVELVVAPRVPPSPALTRHTTRVLGTGPSGATAVSPRSHT
jgi:hypothetical protein